MTMAKTASGPDIAQRVAPIGPDNVFSFTQVAAILNQIVRQATGQDVAAPINTSEFVTQADTAYKVGYNKLIPTITAVMTRTIFSSRPYTAAFRGMLVNNERWGYLQRKLTAYDDVAEDNKEYDIKDGEQAGCWPVKVPKVLQTVFMGGGTWQHQIPFFKNQLDTAFTGPDEFARFVAMYVQEYRNAMTQEVETLARMTLVNQMGAINQSGRPEQTLHLLTEYNTETGLGLTSTTVMQPDNYVPFILWVYARIQNLMDMMTVRGVNYHISPKIGDQTATVKRHTPRGYQRFYMSSYWGRMTENRVTTDIFGPDRLQVYDYETVPFWQTPNNPNAIQVTPSTVDAAGHTITGTAVSLNNVFGVLNDIESCGVGLINQWSATTPFDARLGTWSDFYHFTRQYFNDMTENAVLLLMD